MQAQLTQPQWLSLPVDVKAKLKEIFNIPRSEGSRVDDNRLVSDGHTHRDLAVITIEAMEGYLELERLPDFKPDFFELFDSVLDKIHETRGVTTPTLERVTAPIPDTIYITFNGKLYRAVEMIGVVPETTPQPLYPAPAIPVDAPKPKATRAPRKKAK